MSPPRRGSDRRRSTGPRLRAAARRHSYLVTPYIGSNAQAPVSVSAPASSKTITGLTGGTTYNFTVTAVNAAGQGPESAHSNAVTPTAPSPPGVPTGVSAAAGSLQATVNWTAPASDGGSPITTYRITPYIGNTAQTPVNVSAPASSKTITGLAGGTTYTFTVTAVNAVGPGPESTPSNPVTPTSPSPPGAPTGVSAGAGVMQATVSWTAPADDGGSPISSYRITPYIGASAQAPISAEASATSKTITGLAAGTTYTFRVTAINALGPGPESSPSNPVTPTATPPLALDTIVTTHQGSSASSISSPAFSTSAAGELLLAFISSDGPSGSSQSFSSVTGGGLTWRLRRRANAQLGTSEIWQANAPSALTNATLTATRSSGSYVGSITVAAFIGAEQVVDGATAAASASTGAPSVSLTTTRAGSWVWGVGNDWDQATARTVGANQTKVDEFLASVGDTLWVQRQTSTTPLGGTPVTLNDTAPTTDQWNLAAIEVLGAASGSPPAAPSLSSTIPPSPANQNSPKVVGSAAAGSQVRDLLQRRLQRLAARRGTAAELGTGITVSVPDNSTTALRATATVAGNTSLCSAPLTYVEDSTAPQTQIGAHPPALSASAAASFEFSGEDPGGSGVASLQCRLDSTEASAWAACTSPKTYSRSRRRRPSLRSAGASTGPATPTPRRPSFEWQIDTTPPETTIDSGPSGATNDPTPTFGFSSTEPGASFQCRLDSASFAPCSPPLTTADPAPEGPHTFEVRATDAAANTDPTPAQRSFTVDTDRPQPRPPPPASPANQNSTTVTRQRRRGLAGARSTPGRLHRRAAGLRHRRRTGYPGITVSVSDNSTTALRATATVDGATPRACSDAAHLLEDSAAPRTTITSGPSGTTNDSTPTFGFSSTRAGLELRMPLRLGRVCVLQRARGDPHADRGARGRRPHLRGAGDRPGRQRRPDPGEPRLHRRHLHPPGPDPHRHRPRPPPPTRTRRRSLGSAAAGSQVSIYSTSDCSGTPLAAGTAAELGTGNHGLGPRQLDHRLARHRDRPSGTPRPARRRSPTSRTRAAPQTQIGAHPPALSASAAASFEFSGEDPGGSGVASLQCRLDSTEASAWAACTSPKTYSGLADGAHRFEARATDGAGNADASPASFEWQIDTTPPTAVIDSGPTGVTNDPTPTFEFHSTEAGSSFACSIDTGTPSFGPCSGPGASHTPSSPLPDGSYTFRVRATDAAGNPATASRSFTVSAGATPPGAPTGVSATAKSAGAQVSWTAPSSGGGSPITGYRITPYVGGSAGTATTTTSAATSASVTGLSNGTTYTFTVAAINAGGRAPSRRPRRRSPPTRRSSTSPRRKPSTPATAARSSSGVKFRSDVAGTVNGIRFYKATANTGTHVGSLWTAAGDAAGPGQLQRRDGLRLAAAEILQPGRDPGQHHLRRRLPRPERPLLAQRPDPRRPASTTRRCTPWPTHERQRRLHLRHARPASRPTPTRPPTTGSTCSSPPRRRRSRPVRSTNVSATAGVGQATVNWSAPRQAAARLTSYRITPYIGSTAQAPVSVAAPATSKTVTGLSAGITYTFTVTAVNAVGSGPGVGAIERGHPGRFVGAGRAVRGDRRGPQPERRGQLDRHRRATAAARSPAIASRRTSGTTRRRRRRSAGPPRRPRSAPSRMASPTPSPSPRSTGSGRASSRPRPTR